jgi:trans-aconitate 2-methyltransferase
MWSPTQYEKFKDQRAQPFHDLVALVEPRPGMRVIDLGCGTGELTRGLHEQLEAAETLGVDSSPEMLAKAAAFATETLHFAQSAIEDVTSDRPYDLVFSNAAVHWVEDHSSLFARLTKLVADDGQLAIQMPANHDHPSHLVAAQLAPQFGVNPRVVPVLSPEEYAALLYRLGFTQQHVRLQVYGHVLESARGVVEWVKGSTLTWYQHRLGDAWPAFLETYTARLLEVLPDEKPFFFPFKRIHIWGRRETDPGEDC